VTGRIQRGLTLIEVAVTLVIAAFGLLGLAGLQARSLSLQVDSESRRLAVSLISQLRERVTANQEGFGQGITTPAAYTRVWNPADAVTVVACGTPGACPALTGVTEVQFSAWAADVKRQLPGAAAAVTPTVVGTAQSMTVTIGWLEPNARAVAPDLACDRIDSIKTDARYRCVTATFFPG
jgi:type IV pilus assembly protein PilV